MRIKYLCVAAVFFCILQGYILKRKVKAENSASIKEGGDREEIEILEEDQETRQEIVEIQEEEDVQR